jgi:valyl-tRNA synthetase
VKPGFEQPISKEVYEQTITYFDELLQLLHPYMPFITEEIHHLLKETDQDLCVSQFTKAGAVDTTIISEGVLLKQVITAIREARAKNQIKPKDPITLHIQTTAQTQYTAIQAILAKQVNAEAIQLTDAAVNNSIVVAVEKDKFYIVTAGQAVDTESLKAELLKDLAYQKGFLESVMKKLGNERFVQNAKPEVIANEEKKKADALARIQTIEESLANLG